MISGVKPGPAEVSKYTLLYTCLYKALVTLTVLPARISSSWVLTALWSSSCSFTKAVTISGDKGTPACRRKYNNNG